MSMAFSDFAPFMADVDEAFKTWDKVTILKLFLFCFKVSNFFLKLSNVYVRVRFCCFTPHSKAWR